MYTQLKNRGMAEPPINVATLKKMKSNKEAIACITAYDASFSLLVDKAGIDVVLVGDSLGMVIQGHDTTVPVTVDDVVYHSNNVAKGLSRAFLIADMPFMSYSDPNQALENSVRFISFFKRHSNSNSESVLHSSIQFLRKFSSSLEISIL